MYKVKKQRDHLGFFYNNLGIVLLICNCQAIKLKLKIILVEDAFEVPRVLDNSGMF